MPLNLQVATFVAHSGGTIEASLDALLVRLREDLAD